MYFEPSLFLKHHADKLGLVPALPILNVPAGSSGENAAVGEEKVAELMQKAGGVEGQSGKLPVILGESESVNESSQTTDLSESQVVELAQVGTKRHDPASLDAGSLLKRAKGVEPSTFTLAT